MALVYFGSRWVNNVGICFELFLLENDRCINLKSKCRYVENNFYWSQCPQISKSADFSSALVYCLWAGVLAPRQEWPDQKERRRCTISYRRTWSLSVCTGMWHFPLFCLIKELVLFYLFKLYECGATHTMTHMWKSTVFERQFDPSAIWVPRIDPRSSGWSDSVFTHWAISLVLFVSQRGFHWVSCVAQAYLNCHLGVEMTGVSLPHLTEKKPKWEQDITHILFNLFKAKSGLWAIEANL